MTVEWKSELIDQLEWQWQNHYRPRLAGLDDDAYLWQPVPGCWSVRRRWETDVPQAEGAGDWVIERQRPEPQSPPVTTIAWRMAHLAVSVFGARAANHFGSGDVSYQTTQFSPRAADGVALLDRHHDAWVAGIRALDDVDLGKPCGPAEGPFSEAPFGALVLHINREALHHGAEIMLLLDLHLRRTQLGREETS